MTKPTKNNIVFNRIGKTEPIDWRQLQFLQQETFKDLSEAARGKLKASIIANNFTQPFYVWAEPHTGTLFCLDGKHRTMILEELSTEGYDIPEMLPATYVICGSREEAAKLVLIYSSLYAKVTNQGLFDFIEAFELDYSALRDEMDLPDFSIDRFEQKFDVFRVNDPDDYEIDFDEPDIFVWPGDVFALGNHLLACGDFRDWHNWNALFGEEKARILFTDPPYNLPADFFLKDNKRHNNHADFAMGAGEMTDTEFRDFILEIMEFAKNVSMDGAIHYIFMDFRHSWHMTDAARTAYGSPIPKQVCVWAKDLMANGSFYRAQQELCFVFQSGSAKNLWNRDVLDHGGFYKNDDELCFIFKHGDAKHLSHLELKDRIRSNVWRYPSAHSTKNPDRYELRDHPTPKPVAMVADAILDTTDPGDIVADFFLGSGTGLIACEKTGRRCRATEIDPRYVQHIVKRYIHYCTKNGTQPSLSHHNGPLTLNDFTNAKHKRSETDHRFPTGKDKKTESLAQGI